MNKTQKINYGYLRVSTDKQDLDNQRHVILDYANRSGLNGIAFIDDTVSTKKPLEKRKIFSLINKTAQAGDSVLVSEVSRLGRNTLEVLNLSKIAIERKINLIIVKQNIYFDNSIQNKIYLVVLGLVAEIERDFIQERTKSALAARKAQIDKYGHFISKAGNKRKALGNPVGSRYRSSIQGNRTQILSLLRTGVNKMDVCRIIGTSAPTLERWLKRDDEGLEFTKAGKEQKKPTIQDSIKK